MEVERRLSVTAGINDKETPIDRVLFASYSRTHKRIVLLTSGTIALLTPFTDTIYLPALSSVQEDFAATASAVAATISAYIAAVAIGELIFGPLSDRYGRLPVIYGALLSYEAATMGCAFAPTMDALIVLRTIQGFFVSSSLVAAQAMIADVFAPEERGTAMGAFLAPLLIGPILAPLIGGALAEEYGWKSTFIFLAVLTVPILVLIVMTIRHETHHFYFAKRITRSINVPETVKKNAGQFAAQDLDAQQKLEAAVHAMERPRLISPWHSLAFAVDPQLAPYYAVVATSFAGTFVSLTLLPIYLALPPYSLSPAIIGTTYLPVGVAMFVGSAAGGVLSDHSLRRFGAESLDGRMTLTLCGLWAVPVGLLAFGFSLGYGAHLAAVLVSHCVLGCGNAMLMPAAMGYISSARPRQAGAAGSVLLFLGFGSSAVGISVSVVIAEALGVAVFFAMVAAAVALAAAAATVLNLRRIRRGTGDGHGGRSGAAEPSESAAVGEPSAAVQVSEPSESSESTGWAATNDVGGMSGGVDAAVLEMTARDRDAGLLTGMRSDFDDQSESSGDSSCHGHRDTQAGRPAGDFATLQSGAGDDPDVSVMMGE